MNSKNALGKGLSALLATDTTGFNQELHLIPLNNILTNPDQPRRIFEEDALKELTESIKVYGVLQPIIVKRLIDGSYSLIAGERRFRASKAAGLEFIPATIVEVDEKKGFEIALLENIQRENLNPLEEAEAYEKLINQYGYTHDQLAKIVSKSRSHISNMVRINALPNDVKELLKDNKLTMGHAKILVSSTERSALAQKIVDEGMTVRDTERFFNSNKRRHSRLIREGAHEHFHKDTDLVEIEQSLSRDLGLNIQINDTKDGGEVVIKFHHLDQLDWIINRLATDYNNGAVYQILNAKSANDAK